MGQAHCSGISKISESSILNMMLFFLSFQMEVSARLQGVPRWAQVELVVIRRYRCQLALNPGNSQRPENYRKWPPNHEKKNTAPGPPDKQLRCYASHDIAPLRGTVGHHRAYKIGRVRYTLYIVKFK